MHGSSLQCNILLWAGHSVKVFRGQGTVGNTFRGQEVLAKFSVGIGGHGHFGAKP